MWPTLNKSLRRLRPRGAPPKWFHSTKDDSTLSAVETAWNAFEGGVDIVVNNSGIGNLGPCLDLTTEAFDEVMNINLRGAFVVSREFAKRMVAAGKRGSIINVSSAAGDGALMWGVPYCASKAAMNHMTRTMARELGPKGIRVNALAPGYIITDINATLLNSPMGEHMASTIPLRKFGDIEKDLHGALLLLASDAGAYMTGSVVVVDGGVVSGTVTSIDPDWKDPI
ncbi:hypothetical protein KFL_000130610 [Klebsormidium nitens]|uniref:Uncharacterized protein n=1 Tax=Klebsormidium nitens TaxID=105231 RepID=A0A1Y1HRK7_KLENI|nr:hypothetical protein KFL_000130610 [Klebsormidium nitens]|eukprot:GAQ78478.1 hypothetical protein KFL_000130610 [Klebsormidium nitens]